MQTEYLVQVVLPVYDGGGRKISQRRFAAVMHTLTERYGGVTAYVHTPAEGRWASHGKTHRDEVIIIEVMTDSRDAKWWKGYRKKLELEFKQEKILIRLMRCETL